MYVDDKRFADYYDKEQPGLPAFLRDAALIYTGSKNNLSQVIYQSLFLI